MNKEERIQEIWKIYGRAIKHGISLDVKIDALSFGFEKLLTELSEPQEQEAPLFTTCHGKNVYQSDIDKRSEQVSEQTARDMLYNDNVKRIMLSDRQNEYIIEQWKQSGYIKQNTPDTVTSEELIDIDYATGKGILPKQDTTEHDTPIDPIEQARKMNRLSIALKGGNVFKSNHKKTVDLYEQSITYRDTQNKDLLTDFNRAENECTSLALQIGKQERRADKAEKSYKKISESLTYEYNRADKAEQVVKTIAALIEDRFIYFEKELYAENQSAYDTMEQLRNAISELQEGNKKQGI